MGTTQLARWRPNVPEEVPCSMTHRQVGGGRETEIWVSYVMFEYTPTAVGRSGESQVCVCVEGGIETSSLRQEQKFPEEREVVSV